MTVPMLRPARATAESVSDSRRSYDPDFFTRLVQIEDRHFWFETRRRVLASLIAQLTADLPMGYRLLEVGCGTGSVLRVLEKTCPGAVLIGMDLFAEALFHARQNLSCFLVQGDATALPFRAGFHVIGLFDVLEHLPEDQQVLCDLSDLLVAGGIMLLTVPARKSLWSYFDEASRHYRRYEAAELHRKLVHAGYQVEYLTHYMASIFPLVWAWRRLAVLLDRGRSTRAEDFRDLALRELRIVPGLNECLRVLLARESYLIARRRILPVGTALVAICRKRL